MRTALFQHGAEQHGAFTRTSTVAIELELGQGIEREIFCRAGGACQAEDFSLRNSCFICSRTSFLKRRTKR